MKKIVSSIMLLFLLATVYTQPVAALNCVLPDTPDIEYNNYDGVFVGKVIEIKETTHAKILTVSVEKSFKGVESKQIKVNEDAMWGESRLHETYLFFTDKKGNTWEKPLCSATTSDIHLADEYLSDKPLLQLKEVEDDTSVVTYLYIVGTIIIVAIVAFFARRLIDKKTK